MLVSAKDADAYGADDRGLTPPPAKRVPGAPCSADASWKLIRRVGVKRDAPRGRYALRVRSRAKRALNAMESVPSTRGR